MTTATSPIVGLPELSRDRSASTASKHLVDYAQDRAEPRSAAAMLDYTTEQQPPQSQGYDSLYSHHSTPPTSTSSHYAPAAGAYLPPPIQTLPPGNGASAPGAVHPHGTAGVVHSSFASPTSPLPSGAYAYAQAPTQTAAQGHYEYEQYHGQYHAHASYPQDHHQHPLSPAADGNGAPFYSGYPIPTGKVDGANGNPNSTLSNGSYSSSASSQHYSRGHPYSHHGSIDEQEPLSPSDMSDRDPSMVYSTSAPNPSNPGLAMCRTTKRRSEVSAAHESPYFYPAQQFYNLFSMDQSTSYSLKIGAKIDRGFFLAAGDWTCYRRNYFQISAVFSIANIDPMLHSEVPCLMDRSGEIVQVRSFAICIGAQIQNGEKVIELVQHTPKRDKGPQMTPRPTHVRAGGDLNQNTSATNPNVVTFERVQFKTATANNGKRRAAQQYYQVHVDLFAELDSGEQVLVAKSYSAPLVVRGRSPGHYADTDEGAPCAAHQISGRYYRNDSISSNGGGPIGAAAGEYPYYSGYGYGSTYQYQSLGSASHIAAQSPPEGGYYERSDMESYPGSPMSPVGPSHPGALDAPQTHHAHPYMTPQVPPGFVSEPVSPDMYNASGFTTPGAESPSSSYGRFPQTHPHAQNGHYPYTPPYSQYPQAQDHQEQDHETQMAGLRIHSPISPSSPGVPTPRRQSFSSSLKKNERASFSGPSSTARKTRSISMSGVTKRAPSSTRSSRTVPVTPTRDLGMGLGITNDRIPEAPMEEHLA